jgi:2-keto-4-pentenoate hydratase/2-oxohepta-3-ene-1,7-dioic acid hydratase in catechol pathway
MRLVTYSFRGATRLGAMLGDDAVVDVARAAILSDAAPPLPDTMHAFLVGGEPAMAAARRALDWAAERIRADREGAAAVGLLFGLREPGFRLRAPVPRPGKALAIGINYRAHAAETGRTELPQYPVVFPKLDTAINDPGAPIQIPRASRHVDWEGELCFVIGQAAHHVSRDEALEYVAGYTIGNDVTVRDWQAHAATWTMGKGFDSHGPIGPYLVTRDEVPDPAALHLRTYVNDELKQDSPTSDLIFDIPALIEYISTAVTLRPGDIVFTGTPSGVGQARDPREWLEAGDIVRVSITGLGELVNPVIDEPA